MTMEEEILSELRMIRELLTPKTTPPPEKPKGLLNEFKEFIGKYKVMGMAVAFILGLYIGALVKALVDDLIMPIISIFTPGIEWEAVTVGPFRVGHFLGALITFIIVALVVFILVKLSSGMDMG